jgi:natural product biosynthesis luciferase-like monooxygenase protein
MTGISTILIGDESLLVGCAEHLLDQGHDIRAVVSRDTQITAWAQDKGLTVLDRMTDVPARCPVGSVDWILSIANLKIIPDEVLALPAKGAVNFHDGPLPRYAGLNTPAWAIWNGETEHGVSWHLIERGVDEGDILEQRLFPITSEDTAYSLNSKCYAAAMDSFPDLVTQLASGNLHRQPQDLSARSYFGRDAVPPMVGWLDMSCPAQVLARQVRALSFGEYRNPLTTPKILVGAQWCAVGHAEAQPIISTSEPGTILDVTHHALHVATGSGMLVLKGIRKLSGAAVDLSTCVSTGDQLGTPEADAADVGERAAKAERHWVTSLRQMQPATLPLSQSCRSPSDWTAHVLDLPADKTERALVALALARMSSGEMTPAIALSGEDHPLLSSWVPLSVGPEASLMQARAALAKQIETANDLGGVPADLVLRDPQINADQPQIALADQPVEGSVVTLTADALHVDRTRLDPDAAELICARLNTILARLADANDIADLCAIPDEEAETLRHTWNATETPATGPSTIHEAFEAQVARTPDATALVFEHEELSYAQLDARANGLAAKLYSQGVKPGAHVGLFVNRGPQLLIGALGILKAGGAYVPLDPAYPADRLAHYVTDSQAQIIVTEESLSDSLPPSTAEVVLWDQGSAGAVESGVGPDDLAYTIYTSGSTGTPKGVMIEHRNVANFFTGMDDVVDHETGGVWLAVTSLAFDISVLELFYTLARGFKVVLISDEGRATLSNGPIRGSGKTADFSLYYWSNDCDAGRGKYELLLEGAKFADANGFDALWTPERHFHAFGGPYPNPAVTGAAVAAITQNLQVRAGSCVAPLHHPARIAEEWAVIDNLTNGGAGLAMASGWHPDDFILRPENTPPNNKQGMFETIDQLRRLWRGEEVAFPTNAGEMLPVLTQPRPVSKELPIWVTTAGNPETWREAGAIGANILTHLLGQSIEEVGEKITLYHQALREAGHDPADHTVTVMLHTLIGEDRDTVMETARGPLKDYLRSAAGLIKQYAWAFPAFKKPEGVSNPFELDLSALEAEEMEAILDFAFERYFFDAGLFGTVEDGLARVEQLKQLGVGEIACLIDYGIPNADVLAGLSYLNKVRERSNAGAELDDEDYSLAAQMIRHRVTHMQCTPSMARMLCMNDETRLALGGLQHFYLGGEALPGSLVKDLRRCTRAKITNMYGPTETTIWSATHVVEGDGAGQAATPLGRPLANQGLYVLDQRRAPVPVGVAGELFIGGQGVAHGYWQRAALTQERFIDSDQGRLYATGDLVRWRADGVLEFLSRMDHQVKIRGQRIELGEIEAQIAQHKGVQEAVVIAREDRAGASELAAYVIADQLDEAALRADLSEHLPDVMVPRYIVKLKRFPLTPNKKIDRKALPAPHTDTPREPTLLPMAGSAADLSRIWARILGVHDIRGSDSFFDLGGHSLLAVQAHREIKSELDVARLSITDIFRFPTLDALAAHLDTLRGAVPAAAPDATEPMVDHSETMSRRKAMRAARNRVAG